MYCDQFPPNQPFIFTPLIPESSDAVTYKVTEFWLVLYVLANIVPVGAVLSITTSTVVSDVAPSIPTWFAVILVVPSADIVPVNLLFVSAALV